MRTRKSTESPSTSEPSRIPGQRRRVIPTWLNRDLALLFGGRGLRSIAQGYLAVIVPLYMAQLGFNAEHIGVLFTASAIASALLAAAVGILSDRFGRKMFLILISLLMAGGGLFFALSGNFIVLVLAGALGTIGRGGGAGSGGAWGPYYPAEQALVSEHASDRQRTSIFGMLSFVGVLAGAIGSLISTIPDFLHAHLSYSLITGYRILFLLTVLLGIVMALVTLPIHERRGEQERHSQVKQVSGNERVSSKNKSNTFMGLSRPSWSLVARFMITNTTNGLAIGVLGSFMVYWFYRRYGASSSAIGELFFLINLAAALPYLLAGRLARKLGAVNTVVITRVVSVLLLAATAMMPTFLLAASLYLLRMIFNTLSNPIRQSYLMGVIPAAERASAAGLSNMPSQVAASISPSVAGYLMQEVSLNISLELAAVLQGINALLYYSFFRNIHPPEESQARGQVSQQSSSQHAQDSPVRAS
jgi:MFS family permease